MHFQRRGEGICPELSPLLNHMVNLQVHKNGQVSKATSFVIWPTEKRNINLKISFPDYKDSLSKF